MKNGYMMMSFCKSISALNAGKFKLRIINDNIPIIPPDQLSSLTLAANFGVLDTDDIYLPNKKHMLARHIIGRKESSSGELVVSLHFQFNVASVGLNVQILDEDQVIYEVKGKGIVTIPYLSLWKETSQKENSDDKQSLSQTIRHKYILQVFADEIDMINHVLIPYNSTYTGPELVNLINKYRKTPVAQPVADKKKKAAGAEKVVASTPIPESTVDSADIPGWKLRIVYPENGNLTIVRDTEKEDKFKAIKAGWEAENPGRIQKAKETRDEYIKNISSMKQISQETEKAVGNRSSSATNRGSGTRSSIAVLKPTPDEETKPLDVAITSQSVRAILEKEPLEYMTAKRRSELWNALVQIHSTETTSAISNEWKSADETDEIPKGSVIVTEDILEGRRKQRQQLQENFKKYQQQVQGERQEDKQARGQWQLAQGDKITGKMNEWKSYKIADNQKRAAYRQSVIKKMEADEALIQALNAENKPEEKEKAGSAGKSKDKKKGKK
jgi:hypothetical protein